MHCPAFTPTLLLAALACRSVSPGAVPANGADAAPSPAALAAYDSIIARELARSNASAAGNAAVRLLSSFRDDVVYLAPGYGVVRGRAAAARLLTGSALHSESPVRWQPIRAGASADGRSGFSMGYVLQGNALDSIPAIAVSPYLAFWRDDRTTNGLQVQAYVEIPGRSANPSAAAAELEGTLLDDSLPAPRAADPLADVVRADLAFSRAATARGMGVSFGEFAAADAAMFAGSGELVIGPRSIRALFAPPAPSSSVEWHPVTGWVAPSNDLAYTVGIATFRTVQNGAPSVRSTKYLTVWKRQDDGSWKFIADAGNARPIR